MASTTPSSHAILARTQNPSSSSESMSNQQPTLDTLLAQLLPKCPLIRSKQHNCSPMINAQISSLSLHPTLEAALHICNSDLSSAHFLVRKMSAPPAVEGMLLHSILHRLEGDFSNSRAWLGDVGDACAGWVPKKRGKEKLRGGMVEGFCNLLEFVYGGEEQAMGLLGDVERMKRGHIGVREMKEFEQKVGGELQRVVEWCRSKYGGGRYEDASSAYVKPGEDVRKMGADMVHGDKGWRKF